MPKSTSNWGLGKNNGTTVSQTAHDAGDGTEATVSGKESCDSNTERQGTNTHEH